MGKKNPWKDLKNSADPLMNDMQLRMFMVSNVPQPMWNQAYEFITSESVRIPVFGEGFEEAVRAIAVLAKGNGAISREMLTPSGVEALNRIYDSLYPFAPIPEEGE